MKSKFMEMFYSKIHLIFLLLGQSMVLFVFARLRKTSGVFFC